MQTPQQQAVQRKLLRLSFCMDRVSSKGLSAPSQSRKSSFSPGSSAASAQVHPHAQDWWVEPGESYYISPNFFVFEEIADSSHLGTSFSGSFFCTGASDVLLKDKTKKKFREPRSQDSQKISEVKKLGFKYCRKSLKALRLVSSKLGETEISSVPNSEVNHLEYFIGSKESAETPAPKRALPGPPSDPRRAGRWQGGKTQYYVTDEEQDN